MKHFLILILSILFTNITSGQDSEQTGLPGDNFSLYGALELFKSSNDLADFEAKLNTEENHVNNLDLNEDGKIDYLRVEDITEGTIHAIVIQAPLSDGEIQDIAVIEIEKTSEETAILQIIGDEEIYPENTIVEPFEEQGSASGGGPSPRFTTFRIVVNVWSWNPIRVIYAPRYNRYVSPWRWSYYPNSYRAWNPIGFSLHWGYRSRYRVNYHRVSLHRVTRAHKLYTPKRTVSKSVVQKTTVIKSKRKGGAYAGKSKTTSIQKGNKSISKSSTTQVGVRKKDGEIQAGKRTKTEKSAVNAQGKTKVSKTKTKTKSKSKTNSKTKKTKKKTKKVVKKKKGN